MLRLTMDTLPGDDSVLLSLLLTLRLVSRGVHDRALCLRRLRELLDLARTTTHFVRAASHGVCRVIAGRPSSPGHVVRYVGHALNDLGDANRGALKTLGRRVPKARRRIGHALTKLQGHPRRQIDRKARPRSRSP
jgi:hypothetical protein